MSQGSRHTVTGILLDEGDYMLVLRVEGGGRWRIDPERRTQALVGRRVRAEGVRAGFDILDVRRIEAV